MAQREEIEIVLDTDASSLTDALRRLDALDKRLAQVQKSLARQIRAQTGKSPDEVRITSRTREEVRSLVNAYRELEATRGRLRKVQIPIHPSVDREEAQRSIDRLRRELKRQKVNIDIEPDFKRTPQSYVRAMSQMARRAAAAAEAPSKLTVRPSELDPKAVRNLSKVV
ncbi:MAG: hypothetical protein QXP01_00295, partial [Candidatus Hadarchaeum sp.]